MFYFEISSRILLRWRRQLDHFSAASCGSGRRQMSKSSSLSALNQTSEGLCSHTNFHFFHVNDEKNICTDDKKSCVGCDFISMNDYWQCFVLEHRYNKLPGAVLSLCAGVWVCGWDAVADRTWHSPTSTIRLSPFGSPGSYMMVPLWIFTTVRKLSSSTNRFFFSCLFPLDGFL